MNEMNTDFLLNASPWTEYRTRNDLLEQDETDPEVTASRKAMVEHPMIQELVRELSGWPGHVLKRHNDASHLIHKLAFLADIGIKASDPGIPEVIEAITSRRDENGFFQIMMNINPRYGGTGEDQLVWVLCDFPTVLYSLLKMGSEFPGMNETVDRLEEFCHENGWPCAADPLLGKFKGPGRKDDPCPYANLISLKAIGQIPERRTGDACRNGVETILKLWDQRKERKPFLFGMGTDFKKLKAPLIWYDILHVLDTLTLFPYAIQDNRFQEMLAILKEKTDDQGTCTPESVWKAWKDWDFGQKKAPSPWITFLAYRILKRSGESAG